MPKCWFVLLRFWLRVDRVLVRLHETRLMGSFNRAPGAPLVSREVRQSEGTFEQLRSAGAPPDGVNTFALKSCAASHACQLLLFGLGFWLASGIAKSWAYIVSSAAVDIPLSIGSSAALHVTSHTYSVMSQMNSHRVGQTRCALTM